MMCLLPWLISRPAGDYVAGIDEQYVLYYHTTDTCI